MGAVIAWFNVDTLEWNSKTFSDIIEANNFVAELEYNGTRQILITTFPELVS